ncbi:CCR4-NOT transcription complex [Ceratocystis lukuohia]|uniref:General negative regulator of transcription subunit n=1 Tax=Ceratocystis lukuohia TaxID=2019550 RepID=A0ABR4MM58_9PEZI
MAARKLQQEVDKCFKKVAEGVAEFEAIYEKIEQSTNPAQKEKLEDNLKREIKKLQRMRDQIKTWAASNDIKDKTPLLDHRKLIETQMEKFKAVEKAMKTKAYSKEGLSAAAKLDPKEKAKEEAGAFLREMVESLELQVEALEVESEGLSATIKRGKNNASKAERISEIEEIIERHKWHQGKLELIRRSLENGGIETEQVTDLEESIRYYVQDNSSPDFIEDEELYDDLHLDADEDNFGMNLADNDKGSSQDTQSIQDDGPTPGEAIIESLKAGSKNRNSETSNKRQVSAQLKSPLPTLATLHPPQPSSSASSTANMKPASVPTRLAGEGLKYASAAAAAAANDKNNVGIAPLPPPPGSVPLKSSATSSPAVSVSHPVAESTKSHSEASSKGINSAKSTPKTVPSRLAKSVTSVSNPVSDVVEPSIAPTSTQTPAAQSAQVTNGVSTKSSNNVTGSTTASRVEEESIYHLPASLQDLLETYEATKARPMAANSPATQRLLEASHREAPKAMDSEMAKHYTPEIPMSSPSTNYPTQPLDILDNPRLYSRLETDTLFYLFYYRQGTMHQYMAARALKDQSWRFHKQYQTWFQRHEEPKSITEEYEQGTYRFFDYESTW